MGISQRYQAAVERHYAVAAIDFIEKVATQGVASRNTATKMQAKDSWGGHSWFFVR